MMDFAQKAAGCHYFSKTDLQKGYHQIPMNPADNCKTAITTPFGLFENTRMPFGLRNASNTFQRKMNWVAADLDFCFAFQNDVEVASATESFTNLTCYSCSAGFLSMVWSSMRRNAFLVPLPLSSLDTEWMPMVRGPPTVCGGSG